MKTVNQVLAARQALLIGFADQLHDPDYFEACVPADAEEGSATWKAFETAADQLANEFRAQAGIVPEDTASPDRETATPSAPKREP